MSVKRPREATRGQRTSCLSRLSRPSCQKATAPWLARAREVFDVEIAGLKKTRDALGPSLCEAVKLMLEAGASGGLVVVTGVGKNLHVAEKMSATFSSTGTRSVVLNPVQAMHGDLGMTSARDILLALSFSGESEEVLRLIPAIRRHGLKVISMTGNAQSTLAKLSDVHVAIPCGKEACPFGMAPTNSVTATLATGDALAMVMIDARKFSVEDYAANHPAGAIGKALVLKVSDIMRTGDALALVRPTATVMDVALAMTKSHGGSAIVVDKAGKLKGIFTDGDLRRVVAGERQATTDRRQATNGDFLPVVGRRLSVVLEAPVSRYMTASPCFVYADAYAAELLKVFERKRIDDLPVCDRKGKVVGLVDLQDLPKMKVL